jgi:cytochrome c oxidase subunit 4
METNASTRVYWTTGIALLVLLVISIIVSELHLGRLGPILSLAIAAVKVTLVALYFMHLRRASSTARIFAVAGVFWLAILLGLTLVDFSTRR